MATKPARARAAPRPAPTVPEDLAAALAREAHAAARNTYQGFSPSAQREYVDWIISAKTEATRSQATGRCAGLDGRGQAAQLEVPEVNGRPLP